MLLWQNWKKIGKHGPPCVSSSGHRKFGLPFMKSYIRHCQDGHFNPLTSLSISSITSAHVLCCLRDTFRGINERHFGQCSVISVIAEHYCSHQQIILVRQLWLPIFSEITPGSRENVITERGSNDPLSRGIPASKRRRLNFQQAQFISVDRDLDSLFDNSIGSFQWIDSCRDSQFDIWISDSLSEINIYILTMYIENR